LPPFSVDQPSDRADKRIRMNSPEISDIVSSSPSTTGSSKDVVAVVKMDLEEDSSNSDAFDEYDPYFDTIEVHISHDMANTDS